MRANLILSLAVILTMSCAAFAAQTAEPPADEQEAPLTFWPTKTMIDRSLDRFCDEIDREQGLDEFQSAGLRAVIKSHIPRFLEENRSQLQRLLAEYLEAEMYDEVPSTEDVADWATRAQPMLAEFRQTVDGLRVEMKEFLPADLVAKLDKEFPEFTKGMDETQAELERLAGGGYDPNSDWVPGPVRMKRWRRQNEAQIQRAVAEQEAAAAQAEANKLSAATSRPSDAWTQYTDAFIKRYDLNAEQQQKAHTYLDQAHERRAAHVLRVGQELNRLQQAINTAETEEQRTALTERHDALLAPTEKIFDELKENLDTLPTRAQRRALEAETQPATSPAEPAPAAEEEPASPPE